jgi:transposase
LVDPVAGAGAGAEPDRGQPDLAGVRAQAASSETWKLSTDPQFIDKVRDIVGLYLNPPQAALVLCVDEKTQVQALDRTAPVLPLLPGTPQRATHDYTRHGTTNLYAALDVASGKVITDLTGRHRAIEFRRFLARIDQAVPAELAVHVICDNSSTHKTPAIQRWLTAHPRFQLHFTPTYSSWLNLVERWFAELTTKWLRRGTHRSVAELEQSIRTWIDTWNDDPKPFVWTKTADQISTASPPTANESTPQDTSRRGAVAGSGHTLRPRT